MLRPLLYRRVPASRAEVVGCIVLVALFVAVVVVMAWFAARGF